MDSIRLFKEHAGYSYDPKTETADQGRAKSARRLATVERKALNKGFYFRWSIDRDVDSSDFDDGAPYAQLNATRPFEPNVYPGTNDAHFDQYYA